MKIVVMLELETDDRRLEADLFRTTAGAVEGRRRIMALLPGGVSRVVAVIPHEMAQMMMDATDEALRALGEPIVRPPPEYVAPGDMH